MKNWIKATLVFLGTITLAISMYIVLEYGFVYYNCETSMAMFLIFSVMMIRIIKLYSIH